MSKRSICFSIFEFLGRINPSVKKKKLKIKPKTLKVTEQLHNTI